MKSRDAKFVMGIESDGAVKGWLVPPDDRPWPYGEQMTVDGAVIRTIAKTTAEGQPIVQRELRRRLSQTVRPSSTSSSTKVSTEP